MDASTAKAVAVYADQIPLELRRVSVNRRYTMLNVTGKELRDRSTNFCARIVETTIIANRLRVCRTMSFTERTLA